MAIRDPRGLGPTSTCPQDPVRPPTFSAATQLPDVLQVPRESMEVRQLSWELQGDIR